MFLQIELGSRGQAMGDRPQPGFTIALTDAKFAVDPQLGAGIGKMGLFDPRSRTGDALSETSSGRRTRCFPNATHIKVMFDPVKSRQVNQFVVGEVGDARNRSR